MKKKVGKVSGRSATILAAGVRVRAESKADRVAREERGAARLLRGECGECSHRWKPRNPSTALNRCPACGERNCVTFDLLTEPNPTPTP